MQPSGSQRILESYNIATPYLMWLTSTYVKLCFGFLEAVWKDMNGSLQLSHQVKCILQWALNLRFSSIPLRQINTRVRPRVDNNESTFFYTFTLLHILMFTPVFSLPTSSLRLKLTSTHQF
ncbi:hypothetical protein EYC84_002011 [Monilinia fructicola]|uniref:Uncharacterized protein n=1 Tax=Monilinia fructicola TaxID=38448 RepID=A0A5M9JW28_MONFR|nr:hypothetical protein EYC84_002011 [Monilinia fructicola]